MILESRHVPCTDYEAKNTRSLNTESAIHRAHEFERVNIQRRAMRRHLCTHVYLLYQSSPPMSQVSGLSSILRDAHALFASV